MSKLLIALAICVGCEGSGVADSEGDPASGNSAAKAESELKENVLDKKNLYTYKLPTDVKPHQVSELEVLLRADSPAATEGYRIEVFAWKPAMDKKGKPKRFPLGGQDVFKPLKKGETTTVYLTTAPPKDAWLQGKSGKELNLGVQIEPASPNREKPDVTLHIAEVKMPPAQ